MDKDDRSFGGLPGGGLLMVALFAAGVVFITKAPLETSRPTLVEPQLERRAAAQNVDARLWQDPFGAVAKARNKQPDSAEDKERSEGRFAEELARQALAGGPSGVVVLAVMTSGGPYAERAESRRRTRYAVLAGLDARGFVPLDSEHLGYFYPRDGEGKSYGLPEMVPFEAFATSSDARDRPDDCNHCRLMVLWLDSSAFDDQPLLKLASLAARVAPPTDADGRPLPMRWRVLGPSSSDGLGAMVEEAARGLGPPLASTLKHFDFAFFSGVATVPDVTLLRRVVGGGEGDVSSFLRQRGVKLLRTTGTDDRLSRSMVNELELRGLHARPPNGRKVKCPDQDTNVERSERPSDLPSSIAIVSEWDTLYGRAQRRLYRYEAESDKPGFCVTRWHYVRGLDGHLPGDAPQATAADSRTKKDGKAEGAEAAGRDAYFERPEGQSQFDYLRRLAARISEEDAELRRRFGREYGIRAIGVLGNDVYDKLQVLQALQTALPHAIFFTTDMDARLFHPRELAWTRNLIVASNFGLRLDDALQRGVPPFRDSYQTSAYLSTMLAMADAGHAIGHSSEREPRWTQRQVSAWFDKPRLFEISRSGAFDFSPPPTFTLPGEATHAGRSLSPPSASQPPTAGGSWADRCSRWRLENCRSLHPDASPMAPDLPLAARFLIAGLLTMAVWVPALAFSRGGKRRLRRFVARGGERLARRSARAALLVFGAVAVAVLPPLLLALGWPDLVQALTRDGKPLSFSEGISPWPTYAIRVATLVLCGYFVVLAWSSLAANIDHIAREFRLGTTRRHLAESLAADEPQHSPWQRLAGMLAVRYYRERPSLLGSRAGMTPAATAFWKHYIVQNRAGARLLRTLLCTLLMIGLGLLVTFALGDPPIAPQRGTLSATARWLTGLPTALAVQFLILFVVDATVLSVFFIRGLRLHHANWPERTLQAFSARTGIAPAYLDDWIDLEFIASRTRSIGKLMYYPFIVLSLLLLARSAFFDDWYTSPTLIVLSMLSFSIVLLCAFALRRSAEASRSHALVRLRDAILRAKGADDGKLVSQLDGLRERIERLNEGAFAPYSQQPLLKAVLLPFLTFGGSSLFDYLAMLNL